jgi:tetratricopeptide (TPR) repeat protein
VADALGVAEGAGLIVDDGAGPTFAHALAPEVVVGHAPASVRRLLHRRLAIALAARGAPLGSVAWHRFEAADGSAAPELQDAAEAALRIGPSRRAMRWLERLVENLDAASERYARALLWLGRARGKVDLDRGRSEVEAARDAADRHGHAAIALQATIVMAYQARMAGAYARAAALLDDATHRAGPTAPRAMVVEQRWVGFYLAWARGDFASAEASLAALETLVPDDASLARRRSTLDWHVGRLERCAERLEGVDRSTLGVGGRGRIDHLAGLAAWALGWPEPAEAFLLRALEAFEATGDVVHQAVARNGVALALLGAGRFDAGLAHALRAARLVRVHGTALFAADAASRRALIALHCDDVDDARSALREAWEALADAPEPYRRSTLLSVRAGAAAASVDAAAAQDDAAEALALAERIGQPLACAVAERALSVAARHAGDAETAAAFAAASARRAARHEMAEQHGHALVMQARALEAADRTGARDAATQARAIGRDRKLPHLAWLAGSVLVRAGEGGAAAEVDHLGARLRARSPSGRLLEL